MSWVRLDDGYPEHAKVADLSDGAFRADVEGWCYAARAKSDGAVPAAIARRQWRTATLKELVTARRWHEGHGCGTETCIRGAGSGYVIHDFLGFNPSSAERNAKSKAASNASRIRWGNADSEQSVLGDGEGVRVGVERKKVSDSETQAFVEFYERAYPRREGRGAARKAWAKAIEKERAEVIIAAAKQFADDPNREPAFTPHPSTWLNQERWGDDPLPPRGGSQSIRHQDRAAQIMQEALREQERSESHLRSVVGGLSEGSHA